jgi:hypothetical protein
VPIRFGDLSVRPFSQRRGIDFPYRGGLGARWLGSKPLPELEEIELQQLAEPGKGADVQLASRGLPFSDGIGGMRKFTIHECRMIH